MDICCLISSLLKFLLNKQYNFVTAAYLDRAVDELKANIASLEENIAIQEEVVAFRKAALDEFLATQEETPAE